MIRFIVVLICMLSSLISCNQNEEVITVLEGHKFETEAFYYDSHREGKKVVIVGGIHGNELAGWKAADQIKDSYESYISSGELLIIPHMNEPAIQAERRYAETHTDLNRSFLGEGDEETVELSKALKDLIIAFEPDLIIDHHESLNNYKNGRLGNSLIVTDVANNVLDIFDVLDILNPTIVDDIAFTLDANPPEGSFNKTLSDELDILVITIETNRKLDLEKRIEEQLLCVKAILAYLNK